MISSNIPQTEPIGTPFGKTFGLKSVLGFTEDNYVIPPPSGFDFSSTLIFFDSTVATYDKT